MMRSDQTRPSRLLLHACCGPCLLEPLDALVGEADSVTIVFANPNIHPAEEYERRRDVLRAYAREAGVDVVELPYEPAEWERAVAPLAASGPERCRACYRLRLRAAARYAADNGFDALTTTLSVSPYQHHDAIQEEGERAAAGAGVAWLRRDFRERYRDSVVRSRELGMYRQNYCGCVFSRDEARIQREERKARKAAEKQDRADGVPLPSSGSGNRD
jgi:predicted adenine nucleotide alpha hydrolase (AANH) superfamily ATPase